MTHFVGLDVSQKMTAICVVDNAGHRLWRGQCPVPEQITVLVRRHAGDEAHGQPIGWTGRGFRPKLCAGLCARWGRLCGAPIWTAGFKLV